MSDRDRNLMVYMYLPEGKCPLCPSAGRGQGWMGHDLRSLWPSQGELRGHAPAAPGRLPRGSPREHLLEDPVPGGCRGAQQEVGRVGEQAHHVVRHAGRRHRAAAAHAGEDLQTAADAPERADHHAAPPRRPQPARLPVRALLPARSVLGPRPRALPHRLPSFPGCCTWTGAPCRMP